MDSRLKRALVIKDPETGEPYYPIGCSGCGEANWWVCSITPEPSQEFRVALVCVNCGYASKGRIIMDERTIAPEEIV